MRKAFVALISIALLFGLWNPGVAGVSKKYREIKKAARRLEAVRVNTPDGDRGVGVHAKSHGLTKDFPTLVQSLPSPAAGSASPTSGPNDQGRSEIRLSSVDPDLHAAGVDPVPILMYHEIGDNPSQLYVSRENFQAQMRYLSDNGFHTVTLDQVYRHFEFKEPLPPKPVAVSFDDGYRTIYTEVYPVLKKHGFVGTFFVFPDAFGRPNYVTWDQLSEMSRAGQSIQSHTRSHVDLTRGSSNPQWLKDQLGGSRALLEQKLGKKVNFLAYPGGFYNRAVMEATRNNGYLAAVTTEEGWASGTDNLYGWKRVRVFRRETVSSLAYKLQSPNYARTPRVIKVRRNVVTE